MSKTFLTHSFLWLSTLALLSGCMVTPGFDQNVGQRDRRIQFSGWASGPAEPVSVYALNGSNQWVLLGQTESTSYPVEHLGAEWYFWRIDAQLPADAWRAARGDKGNFRARVVARDRYDFPIRCWQRGFYDYCDDYDTLRDLWVAKGHFPTAVDMGSIVIWADE